jgi:pSer/pThr/pTyr-binding forkhead associated (FHA) protein
MLIKMLGGNVGAAPPGAPVVPGTGAYPHPGPAAPPPGPWGAPAAPQQKQTAEIDALGPPPNPAVPAAAPPPQIAPFREPDAVADDEGRTMMMAGADLARLKVPGQIFTLQIMDKAGQWHVWTTVGGAGIKVGRAEKNAQFPELSSMATRHMRVALEGPKVKVEDLGALNGIYLRLTRPVELAEGAQFRVGGQVLEFRAAEPVEPAAPQVAEDGEEFWSRDVQPLAFVDIIRPDGQAGLRFPITKRDVTIFGREGRPGRPVDVAFPDDSVVSGQHAQIRHQDGKFFLEDLNSRNGTFIRIRGENFIDPGEVLLVGRVLLRVVGQ